MPLNSAKVIPEWTAWYSGICWYFANSAAQSASESGGMMPMTGFHSVIDRPDSVSRVIPPTTTIRKINAQQPKSHAATAPRRCCRAATECAVVNAEIDKSDLIRCRSRQSEAALARGQVGQDDRRDGFPPASRQGQPIPCRLNCRMGCADSETHRLGHPNAEQRMP